MIRFNCPTCGRRYDLADAMAHLPLLCKGCGHRLAVPDPTPDEPRLPDLDVAPAPAAPPEPRQTVAPPARTPVVHDDEDDRPYLIPEPEPAPDIRLDAASPPAAPVPPVQTPKAEPPPRPTPAAGANKVVPVVVDVAVGLILLMVGVFAGETLARQSTGQVLREAGSSARVPSTELMLWLAPTVLLGLGYALLVSRGRTVGGWLKRRNPS